MDDQIDVSGYDLSETLGKERRRRRELSEGAEIGDLHAFMLPLALALARLSARVAFKERLS